MEWRQELIAAAQAAQLHAYAPYSGIAVGAALRTSVGLVFAGCNIENASYAATICAERTAFAKALSTGQQAFQAIAIVGGKYDDPAADLDYFYPCGICRQWMVEFCGPEFIVLAAKNMQDYREICLAELLPHSFGPGHLR